MPNANLMMSPYIHIYKKRANKVGWNEKKKLETLNEIVNLGVI